MVHSTQFREPQRSGAGNGVIRLLNSSPPGARCAGSSGIGTISRRGNADVWRGCFRLVVVIAYDLYAKARCALRRIERRPPLSGCLRVRRGEVLPVVAAHIRVYIELPPAILERTFEWFITRVCVHMDGKTAGTVEPFGAVRTGVSSPAVRLPVSSNRRSTIIRAEFTLG